MSGRVEDAAKAMVDLSVKSQTTDAGELATTAIAAADAWDADNGVHRVSLDDDAVNAALFKVESVHHIHGTQCLCGFRSSVSRDRTKHIMEVTLAAAVKEGQ